MSIASELNRLLQAKSDLATSIAAKGITVPAATTIDGYAALVDQIQTGGGSPLPTGAVEISYIQGDGNAYIDTGVKASSSVEFEAGIYVPSSLPVASTSIIQLLGSRVDNNNTAFTVQYYNTSGSKYWRWNYGNVQATNTHNNIKGNFVISNRNNINSLVVTGAQICYMTCTASTFSSNYNIHLLAINNSGTANVYGNAYACMKYCKIYVSGTLTRDFVSVRINQVGYMYDKVNKQLYGNAGTGSFNLGPDVT